VIRRQFRQLEATWYDSEKIRLSRDRVDRLGFFSGVTVETQEIAGVPDQVDLLFTVEERPTNALNVGIGASTTDKLMLNFGFRQENAFGSGKNISTEINTSDFNRTVVFSMTDPFFTQNGVSSTYDLYHRTSRPYLQSTDAYSLVNGGLGLRFGIPIAENHTLFLGAGLEQTRINRGTSLPQAYDDYIANFGATSSALPLTLGWAGDGRDSALSPTRGIYQRVNIEISPVGDARYVKASYNWQRYIALTKKYTWGLNADIGWGEGLGDRPFPVFKNYFVGGLGSVRGFEYGALGVPDSATNVPLGGPKKLVFNTELMAPFPGAGNDRTLRTFAFADAGASYGEHESYDLSLLRTSVGMGISWLSPLGPLKFSYGVPVRKQTADKIQKFQFNIGTSF
jgi:outer membrane protein insertion porin family